jgi:hypothetical protein
VVRKASILSSLSCNRPRKLITQYGFHRDTEANPPTRTAEIAAGVDFAFAYDDEKRRLMASSAEYAKRGIMVQVWQV